LKSGLHFLVHWNVNYINQTMDSTYVRQQMNK
jgi:hypothetical protein